jgi:hypothetical protein
MSVPSSFYKTCHWNCTNRSEIMKLLTFFSLQGVHQKTDMIYYSRRKILEALNFCSYLLREGFIFYSGFFISVLMMISVRPSDVPKDCIN